MCKICENKESFDNTRTETIIERAKANIATALCDYVRHADKGPLVNVSDAFVERLAEDSTKSKQGLRELFSKSPAYDPSLDAIVINGTRTHDPDYNRINNLVYTILESVTTKENVADITYTRQFFATSPNVMEATPYFKQRCIEAIDRLAPKAYKEGRKLSRIFKSLCVSLGVADETVGSEFQKLYARLVDELSAKKIDFKLFVSINPAHFLTMSNPKKDSRGNTLTSCHSLNSTEYIYNNGCSGYARDEVSFIVFTAADPDKPETLNNRKTTRQIFAYRPGSGLLLQSRLYNTSGGTRGAQEESKLYRDLVQRELSTLEGKPNLWKTYSSTGEYRSYIKMGVGFGGYPDWIYSEFNGKISFRADCDRETVAPLEVGAAGLCINCAEESSDGLYCNYCTDNHICEHCDHQTDELFTAYDTDYNELFVCSDCAEQYYTFCPCCERMVDNDVLRETAHGQWVCSECATNYYTECSECGELYPNEEINEAFDEDGFRSHVCNKCIDDNYVECNRCHDYHHRNRVWTVYSHRGGHTIEEQVCEDCFGYHNVTVCPHCGEHIILSEDDKTYPCCEVVIEKKEKEQ